MSPFRDRNGNAIQEGDTIMWGIHTCTIIKGTDPLTGKPYLFARSDKDGNRELSLDFIARQAERRKSIEPSIKTARAKISGLGGYAHIDQMPLAQRNAYAATELASSFGLNAEYWYKHATENNIDLLPYLRRIDAETDPKKRMAILDQALDEVSGIATPAPANPPPAKNAAPSQQSPWCDENHCIFFPELNKEEYIRMEGRSLAEQTNKMFPHQHTEYRPQKPKPRTRPLPRKPSFTYAPIQPSTGLTPKDAAIEKKAVAKLQANRAGMLKEYTGKFGKVVNADLARRLFADVGYNGRNAAAVHEPSSALAKDAWRHNLKYEKQPDVVLYAGMSGAGKSSAVTGVLPHVEDDAAAILDGNLSKISTAEERIKEALDAGKDPIIVYVWRDPVDAWVNGVVKRMKSNAEEGGRVVPMSEALKNGPGSLATVRAAISKGAKFNEDVYIVDNSLGPKNARLMDREKFDALSYPDNLRDTLLAKTTELYHDGQITQEQYTALIA